MSSFSSNNTVLHQKRRSLRSVLIALFLVFSVAPICFVAWYSVFKFEKAIDNEFSLRLKSNGREVEVMISDFYASLLQSRDLISKNPPIGSRLRFCSFNPSPRHIFHA